MAIEDACLDRNKISCLLDTVRDDIEANTNSSVNWIGDSTRKRSRCKIESLDAAYHDESAVLLLFSCYDLCNLLSPRDVLVMTTVSRRVGEAFARYASTFFWWKPKTCVQLENVKPKPPSKEYPIQPTTDPTHVTVSRYVDTFARNRLSECQVSARILFCIPDSVVHIVFSRVGPSSISDLPETLEYMDSSIAPCGIKDFSILRKLKTLFLLADAEGYPRITLPPSITKISGNITIDKTGLPLLTMVEFVGTMKQPFNDLPESVRHFQCGFVDYPFEGYPNLRSFETTVRYRKETFRPSECMEFVRLRFDDVSDLKAFGPIPDTLRAISIRSRNKSWSSSTSDVFNPLVFPPGLTHMSIPIDKWERSLPNLRSVAFWGGGCVPDVPITASTISIIGGDCAIDQYPTALHIKHMYVDQLPDYYPANLTVLVMIVYDETHFADVNPLPETLVALSMKLGNREIEATLPKTYPPGLIVLEFIDFVFSSPLINLPDSLRVLWLDIIGSVCLDNAPAGITHVSMGSRASVEIPPNMTSVKTIFYSHTLNQILDIPRNSDIKLVPGNPSLSRHFEAFSQGVANYGKISESVIGHPYEIFELLEEEKEEKHVVSNTRLNCISM